jgi:hypothetical protein
MEWNGSKLLVGSLEHFFHSVGNVIIPTVTIRPSFFRGVGPAQPPTRLSSGLNPPVKECMENQPVVEFSVESSGLASVFSQKIVLLCWRLF